MPSHSLNFKEPKSSLEAALPLLPEAHRFGVAPVCGPSGRSWRGGHMERASPFVNGLFASIWRKLAAV
jgi:hypothetical protein